jgi:transposase
MNKLQVKNRYLYRSHLTEAQTRAIVRLFAEDLSALSTARLTEVNRNTVNRIYRQLRQLMARSCEAESPLAGEVEADESYFGPKRVPGKRGRGAGGKTIVFGLLKRGGKVYTQIVPDAQKATLQAVIRGKVALESILYTDSWRAYDGLVDVGYDKHLRVKHGQDEFVEAGNPSNHINGIESFWTYTKRRLQKYNGVPKMQFYLILKESEYGFNHRQQNLYLLLLRLLNPR